MAQQPTDTEQLRNSLTREVSTDAYQIAQQVFRGQEPDVARVSNAQLDARYHQAILNNDRQYLLGEAARDPVQFLASMDRLINDGHAYLPPGQEVPSNTPPPRAARSNVPVPKPPPSTLPQPYDVNHPPELPPPSPPPLPSAPVPPPTPSAGMVPPPPPPAVLPPY